MGLISLQHSVGFVELARLAESEALFVAVPTASVTLRNTSVYGSASSARLLSVMSRNAETAPRDLPT